MRKNYSLFLKLFIPFLLIVLIPPYRFFHQFFMKP